jgi:enamine deaminase RidA (YjgF/YER057c/UK114 family)
MSIEDRLKAIGLEIPRGVSAAADYVPATLHNGTLYVSGQIPRVGTEVKYVGRVGVDCTLADAKAAAQICAARILGVARDFLGSLDRVQRVLELTVYVNADASFTEPSAVADAASDVMVKAFLQAGTHARSAVCVAQLPKGAMVEVSAILAV